MAAWFLHAAILAALVMGASLLYSAVVPHDAWWSGPGLVIVMVLSACAADRFLFNGENDHERRKSERQWRS